MANSKYEYVKSFEVADEIMFPNLIVLKVDGCDFRRLSKVHGFEKPSDERALRLMNSCAIAVIGEFPDIVFAYGFSDEYSFILKRTTQLYQRRASKVLSLAVSFFASNFVTKWREFFPHAELQYPPSFHGCVSSCASVECLQAYLAWRQCECHITNQYDTCFWMLVKFGKTEKEACEILKNTQKYEKHELLFHKFGLNYKDLPPIFRQGSCVVKRESEEIAKCRPNGAPILRVRRIPAILHAENIAGRSFWTEHSLLHKELGDFVNNVSNVKKELIRSFTFENQLMPATWIVVRIDGCHFHRFSEIHNFEKPNDMNALSLMNSCAMAVLENFSDVSFAYGVSDEYSFVLKKDSQLYHRRSSKIVSVIVSFFSSMYVMKWKTFFPQIELKYPPSFDGRTVCYPSSNILKDYLCWRQVDCHINTQYNTCFWMLVKSGKTKAEAQSILKGTQTSEKMELLKQQFGIDYCNLPEIFRNGSSVYRSKATRVDADSSESSGTVILETCNIIEPRFWEANPNILE